VAGKLIITLKRGLAGKDKRQIANANSLGLYKTHDTVEQPDNPAIRGMITKIAHLVEVKEA